MTDNTIQHYRALAADPATPPAKLCAALRHALNEVEDYRGHQNGKLTRGDIADILHRKAMGESIAAIARTYNMTPGGISHRLNGRRDRRRSA